MLVLTVRNQGIGKRRRRKENIVRVRGNTKGTRQQVKTVAIQG
jgi:hypothetical protein